MASFPTFSRGIVLAVLSVTTAEALTGTAFCTSAAAGVGAISAKRPSCYSPRSLATARMSALGEEDKPLQFHKGARKALKELSSMVPVVIAAASLGMAPDMGAAMGTPDLKGTPLQRTGSSFVVEGVPRIVDGDTIVIDEGKGGKGERVRLLGIDAPESKQVCKEKNGKEYMCGIESQKKLQQLVGNDKVKCLANKRDMYQRVLGVCYDVRTGVDLNKAMVDEGEAIAYVQYSKAYLQDEQDAQAKKAGVWRGDFEKPWEYRKLKRQASQQLKSTVKIPKKKDTAAKAPPADADVGDDELDDAPQ